MTMKLGKKAPTYDSRDLKMVEFVTHDVGLKLAPTGFDVAPLFSDWGMLGNDRYGDCAWAGPAHEHMIWNKLAGKAVSFSDAGVLSDYAACTGFDPATGANDNGTDVREMLKYRHKIGIIDALGKRHKIGGFAALEPGNWTQLLAALEIFDAVAVGIEFPVSAMDQFNAGKPWSVVAGASIEGGHYVPVVARPGFSMVDVVTWAKTQQMTRRFYSKYNDETWGLFTTETLINGRSAQGFSLADYKNALKEL